MSEELEAARRYRMHAEELRVIASESITPKIRDTLKKLAADYESMARSMEAIDRTHQTLRLFGSPPAGRRAPESPASPSR